MNDKVNNMYPHLYQVLKTDGVTLSHYVVITAPLEWDEVARHEMRAPFIHGKDLEKFKMYYFKQNLSEALEFIAQWWQIQSGNGTPCESYDPWNCEYSYYGKVNPKSCVVCGFGPALHKAAVSGKEQREELDAL